MKMLSQKSTRSTSFVLRIRQRLLGLWFIFLVFCFLFSVCTLKKNSFVQISQITTNLRLCFKNSFPLILFLFFSLWSRMSRNRCKLCHKLYNCIIYPHEVRILELSFFKVIFTDNKGHFSTNLRPQYQNSFKKNCSKFQHF